MTIWCIFQYSGSRYQYTNSAKVCRRVVESDNLASIRFSSDVIGMIICNCADDYKLHDRNRIHR